MSNLIKDLPINTLYTPTPMEINNLEYLIPETKQISYTEYLILSCMTSLVVTIIIFIILKIQKHTITTLTLIILYLLTLSIVFTSNILSKYILNLISPLL